MAPRSYLGDRRQGLRLRVHGELWASIDVRHQAVLHDITLSGALLEMTVSPVMRAARLTAVALPDGGPQLTGLVRHITPIADAGDRCLLGVEFIDTTGDDGSAIRAFIDRWTKPAARG